MVDAEEVIEEAQPRYEKARKYLRDAAEFFHDNEGELFKRSKAQTKLIELFNIPKPTSNDILSELVSDTVDPVIQVERNGQKYVGVAEFKEFDGAYGYVEYDDRFGKSKRIVCQQCVNEATLDSEVVHATENDPTGSFSDGADYDELVHAIHKHYQTSHNTKPSEIKTGASLVTGTTVGGNTSIHTGNEADLSFYDGTIVTEVPVDSVNGKTGTVSIDTSETDDIRFMFLPDTMTSTERENVLTNFGPPSKSRNYVDLLFSQENSRNYFLDSQSAMETFSSSQEAMDLVQGNTERISYLMKSGNSVSSFWASDPGVYEFLKVQGSKELPHGFSTAGNITAKIEDGSSFSLPGDTKYALYIDISNSDSEDGEVGISYNFDLTDVDTLEFKDYQSGYGFEVGLKVDGSELYSNNGTYSWGTRSVDVSGYSGVNSIKYYHFNDSVTNASGDVLWSDINLI